MSLLLDRAREDLSNFLQSDLGAGVVITLTTPASFPTQSTVEIKGWHSKHHQSVDEQGVVFNSKNAHITIMESVLTDLNYPVRNTKDQVDLEDHRVTVKDSTGFDQMYVIDQSWPDETLGNIVCILSDYEEDE